MAHCFQTSVMDPITPFLKTIDPLLIAPYRLFEDPMLGWWLGTLTLAFWSVLVGELTLAVVYRINRTPVTDYANQTLYYHEQSLKAKQAGDEKAYKGINKLANEAYGKSFFLFIAMGMASLWPAFFAAAWRTESKRRQFSNAVTIRAGTMGLKASICSNRSTTNS